MIRRMTMALAAVFTLALVFGSVVRAHEGHDHKIMGTVTMAAADHVMLKDTDGKDVTVKVNKDTKVKAKTTVKVEEIKAGTRVVITAAAASDSTSARMRVAV